jgi:predicted regulator of Ras-like GTPase activity (Roadblock/LC7/MglB family)
MTLKGPEFKKALLLGLMTATAPLLYYPNTFGWSRAASGSAELFVLEMLYYLLVFQFLFAREPFVHRVKAAFTTLAFRLSLGVVFAILTMGIFSLEPGEALSAGVYGYLPAALLHMALVPYLMKPVFRFRELRRQRLTPHGETFSTPSQKATPSLAEAPVWAGTEHMPDFDAAVSHVATYSTVGLVLLVDEEGLCVARASRGTGDSDLWAPVINLLYDSVIKQLRRTSDSNVRRLQVTLSHERLVVERVEPFYLAVLFDQNTDELVNVRIAQAVEMVKRFYEHKYPKVAREAATEVAYV